MTYILLPPAGSVFWRDGVASVAELPVAGATIGEARLDLATGVIYYWTGSAWLNVSSTVSAATVRAMLSSGSTPLAYDATTGTFTLATATAAAAGVVTAADWSAFNAKEPAIAAGTTSQFWRGDKSFQALTVASVAAVVDGSAASTGVIGEVLTTSQVASTATGVAASGAWGAVTSTVLSAGRWRIWGTAAYSESGAVLTTSLAAGVSASATGVGLDELDTVVSPAQVSGAADTILATPHTVVSLGAPTTYHLNSRFYYTSGTPQHRGKLTAVRVG